MLLLLKFLYIIYIYNYNCPCNVRHSQRSSYTKKPLRQGKTVKLRPQFSKWRSQKLGQKGKEELEN